MAVASATSNYRYYWIYRPWPSMKGLLEVLIETILVTCIVCSSFLVFVKIKRAGIALITSGGIIAVLAYIFSDPVATLWHPSDYIYGTFITLFLLWWLVVAAGMVVDAELSSKVSRGPTA